MTDEDKLGLDVTKFAMPQTPLPEWAQQAVGFEAGKPSGEDRIASGMKEQELERVPEEPPSIEEEVEAPASDAHNMSWVSARLCLRRGQKVRRNGWASEGQFLSMNGDGEIEISRVDGVWPYPNPRWDVLANDWQVVG